MKLVLTNIKFRWVEFRDRNRNNFWPHEHMQIEIKNLDFIQPSNIVRSEN